MAAGKGADVPRTMRLKAPPEAAPEFGHALVVIHGVGQQQPFEPLDSFVNGLRSRLVEERPADPEADRVLHMTLGREHVFDHAVRVEAADLDIYEVYWAPLTQRQATFLEIVQWLIWTSLTPLQQFAFNLPLLFRRVPRDGAGRTRLWYLWCLARELWRMTWIVLAGLVTAGLAAGLVSSSVHLLGEFPSIWRSAMPPSLTWRDALTEVVFIVGVVATAVTGWSLLSQLREVSSDTPAAPPPGARRPLWRVGVWLRSEGRERMVQSDARGLFLVLTVLVFVWWCWALYRLVHTPPPCLAGFCVSDIVTTVWEHLGTRGRWHVLVIATVAVSAAVVKVFFLDYVADIALYTVSNENSPHAKVRRDILAASTGKVRWLLRKYETVTLAGHSLGSVVAYDTINWLRGEVRVAEAQATDIRRRAAALRALLAKTLSGTAATAAEALVDRVAAGFGAGWAAAEAGHARQALQDLEMLLHEAHVGDEATTDQRHALEALVRELADPVAAPVCRAELNRLKTLVTFGSPLNKVLYFFRTRVEVGQTVRGHIVNDLHGFRLPRDLFASDPGISDDTAAGEFTNEVPPDGLYWLNVSAPLDLVSASLDFYDGVHEYRRWYWLPGGCHGSYWRDRRFYEEVLAAIRRRPGRARAPFWAARP
ncbi:MAG TPA: hypothetical protein VFO18_16785 [Methylomirabilota bacterium]|nr:hypothetical protein [Methylomirabilota bacterium]